MTRPADFLAWFAQRSAAGKSDLPQLVDGLMPGGTLVIGGAEINAAKALPILSNALRVAKVQPLAKATLHPNVTATFDAAAIAQLIMIARNESFHEVAEMCVTFIKKKLKDGHDVSVALELLSEEINKVQHI